MKKEKSDVIIEEVLKDEKMEFRAKTESQTEKKERILSIDRFRGLCILLMVCSFILSIFSAFDFLGPIVKHHDDGFQILPGVSFADIFAPMFIFVIGLTIVKSFNSRAEKYGAKRAYWQLAIRFLALAGIGILFNGLENWGDIFIGDGTFGELSIKMKIFCVMFWIAIALLIVYLISLAVKNKKFKKVSLDILYYFLAIAGVMAIYFLLVNTGEYITEPANGPRFGGWEWDTLQNIGLAGLMALPFIKYSKSGKLVIVGVGFAVLTVLMQNGLFPVAKKFLEGGILGGFSWAGILLLGSVFFDLRDDKRYWILSSLLLLISTILIISFDFFAAKKGGTPVYAMFTASLASMIWGGLNYLNNWKPKFDFLAIWGSNAILTYLITLVISVFLGGVLGAYVSPLHPAAAVVIWLVIMALFTLMNWYLRKKNRYIRI